MAPETPYIVFGAFILVLFFHLFSNYYATGVTEIPGPFVAKLTNLVRLVKVSRGYSHVSHIALHEQYGDNVRLGPSMVSIKNIKDVNKVYSVKQGYAKSDFYAVQQQLVNGKATQTLFTTLNENFHARIKRPVANAYSMTTLTTYEPLVNRTIMVLFDQLDARFASTSISCPLFEWLQYYAFDTIGELTCSESFGFLSNGCDVGGIIEQLNQAMDYNAVVGQIPWLDHLLKKNPILARLGSSTGPVANFAIARLKERFFDEQKVGTDLEGRDEQNLDFVDRFVRAKELYPETVDDKQILSYMITNMFAGSDTTAISLRAILYYTLKHPQVHVKLLDELDIARSSGALSVPTTWRESQHLSYFNAVVQESLRLHPAVGLVLERIVPEGGLELDNGTVLPGGTIVGASPWVMHRDKTIFGDDVESFRPERWLKDDTEPLESFEKRLKAMNGATFTFGKGHRTCIGKNISLLEIYKLLPSLFLTYDIQLVHPDVDWKIKNSWFVRQENVEFLICHRP